MEGERRGHTFDLLCIVLTCPSAVPFGPDWLLRMALLLFDWSSLCVYLGSTLLGTDWYCLSCHADATVGFDVGLGAHPVGELCVVVSDGGCGLHHDQQVQRGLPRRPVLRRQRVHRPSRVPVPGAHFLPGCSHSGHSGCASIMCRTARHSPLHAAGAGPAGCQLALHCT